MFEKLKKELRDRIGSAEEPAEIGLIDIFENESPVDSENVVTEIMDILCELDEWTFNEVAYRMQSIIRQSKTCQKEKKISLDSIPKSYVGIDFETLYSQRVSVCSVGMVKYKDGEVVDRFYSLIRPPFDYPSRTGRALTWIHGFRETDFLNERTFAEILPEMEAFAEGLPLVAHNSCVERDCIRDSIRFYGLSTTLDYLNIIDTCPLSHKVEEAMGLHIKGSGTHSLDSVCQRFNIPVLSHHNALDDAEMCGNLLAKFARILDASDLTLAEKPKNQTKKYEKYNPEDKIQRMDLENVVDNPFKDCTVVLTGFPNSVSQEYGHRLKELGAKVRPSVSGKTNWLICGQNAGPKKIADAQSFGVQIISEEEFLSIIQNY